MTPPRKLLGFFLQTSATQKHNDKHSTTNFADQGAETENGDMFVSVTLGKQSPQHLAQMPALD